MLRRAWQLALREAAAAAGDEGAGARLRVGSLRRLLSEPRVLATIGLTRGLAEEEREQALREMSEAQSASDSASESDSDPSGPKAGPESDADACATSPPLQASS